MGIAIYKIINASLQLGGDKSILCVTPHDKLIQFFYQMTLLECHESRLHPWSPTFCETVDNNVQQCNGNHNVCAHPSLYIMPPPHPTLAKPKSQFLKHNLHTIDIIQCRAQLANDVAWFKSGGFKPQAPTLPSVPRHEARMQDL